MNSRYRLFAALLATALLMVPPAIAADDTPAGSVGPEIDTPAGPEIVGGTEAPAGAYPFVTALVWRDVANARHGLRCGGTLIEPGWVLTAAHCTDTFEAADFDVVVGRHALTSDVGERIAVAEIFEYPGWDPYYYEHDIALLRLETPATVGETIAWVTRPLENRAWPETVVTVAGWGTTEDNPPGTGNGVQNRLREADVPIRTDAECDAAVPEGEYYPDAMFCAGFVEGGIDSCAGDSGGPVFVMDGARWRQVGIVSWGYGCADPGDFGYYTRLSSYGDWIEEITGIIACEGVPATQVGTPAGDELVGTDGDDVIVGGEGDDVLLGHGGDDLLCGGPGRDSLYGGPGNDLLFGGDLKDRLLGAGGSDELYGGAYRDFMKGGSDDDLIFGGEGRDIIKAFAGDDIVFAGPNNDIVYGGGGNDDLLGEGGDDILYGGRGEDLVLGGDGSDDVRGQGDDDEVFGGGGDDDVYGGAGLDTVDGGPGIDVCSTGEIGFDGCETIR